MWLLDASIGCLLILAAIRSFHSESLLGGVRRLLREVAVWFTGRRVWLEHD